jgi:membrane protein DedA with SNARE-associated domain
MATLGPAMGWIALTAGSSIACLVGYLVGVHLGRPLSSRFLTRADESHIRSVIASRGSADARICFLG